IRFRDVSRTLAERLYGVAAVLLRPRPQLRAAHCVRPGHRGVQALACVDERRARGRREAVALELAGDTGGEHRLLPGPDYGAVVTVASELGLQRVACVRGIRDQQ